MQRRTFLKGLGSSLAGGLCPGRVVAQAADGNTESAPQRAAVGVLEGPFGRVEVDLVHPRLTLLCLRQSDGRLGVKQLLSTHASDFPEWAVGGASYLVGVDGQRYDSRCSTEHRAQTDRPGGALRITGIRPRTVDGVELSYSEDWTLTVTPDGGLRWEIDRRFEQDFAASIHGGPALFFNISPNTGRTPSTQNRLNPGRNGVAVSWWVAEEAVVGEPLDLYRKAGAPEVFLPVNKSVTMRAEDGWAIFKLYTSFPHDQDLRLQAEGGHLYRRGMFWAFTEVGLAAGPSAAHVFKKGQRARLALAISPVPQRASGQQLLVSVPDKVMEDSLKSYFGGLANAGVLADCEKHLLGNECDGYLYAGNMWMHAYSLLASAPAAAPLSSAPVGYADAVGKTLQYNLSSVNQQGQVTAGFTHGSEFPELPMMNIIALEAYLLQTGDVQLARQQQAAVERMDRYLQTWIKDGLFCASTGRLKSPTGSINWYYDELRGAHGFTLYHNLNYVRALASLATIYTALGQLDRAGAYAQRRRQLIQGINDRFWDDNGYGGGMHGYVDWIHEDGQKGLYFFACNQYPAILYGVAGTERTHMLLQTADARIAELKRTFRYTGEGTLDNLWPLQSGDIQRRHLRFGGLMDGGLLLCMTFWEVAARCRAGDADGAYQLLKRFSEHAARTNWYEGVNVFSIDGQPVGWEGDPYLADQLVAAAALVHGFLGLDYSWEHFTVTPHLPAGWDAMSATIMFKGLPYNIAATADGRVRIRRRAAV